MYPTLAASIDNEAVELFASLLALLALFGSLSVVAIKVTARTSPSAAGLVEALSQFSRPIPALVSVTATVGSLYFSEVVGYTPCTLCWYQRICMYSIAVIMTCSLVYRDANVRRYAVPLAAIGSVISAYHWLLERLPQMDAGACSAEVPCSFVWFENFGFVTLSFMALCAFITTIVFTTLPPRSAGHDPMAGPASPVATDQTNQNNDNNNIGGMS